MKCRAAVYKSRNSKSGVVYHVLHMRMDDEGIRDLNEHWGTGHRRKGVVLVHTDVQDDMVVFSKFKKGPGSGKRNSFRPYNRAATSFICQINVPKSDFPKIKESEVCDVEVAFDGDTLLMALPGRSLSPVAKASLGKSKKSKSTNGTAKAKAPGPVASSVGVTLSGMTRFYKLTDEQALDLIVALEGKHEQLERNAT